MARGYYHVMIAPNRFRQGVVSGATLPAACLSPKRTFGREAPLVSVANALLPVFINTHSPTNKNGQVRLLRVRRPFSPRWMIDLFVWHHCMLWHTLGT